MEYKFNFPALPSGRSGKIYKVNVELRDSSRSKNSYLITIDDKKPVKVEVLDSIPNSLSLMMNGEMITTYIVKSEGKNYISLDGDYFIFELERGKARKTEGIGAGKGKNSVSSPMPGAMVKVLVSKGDKVEAGQTLAIVEAMKMENELKSPSNGIVKKINFSEGDQVDAGQPIVELTRNDTNGNTK